MKCFLKDIAILIKMVMDIPVNGIQVPTVLIPLLKATIKPLVVATVIGSKAIEEKMVLMSVGIDGVDNLGWCIRTLD